ncbi:MAG: helix-turn-helix transcriptional regulator [Firmicutes bacterium]|nr:helix-turn-helix transcriptional regulator [Bacillota bacterium]
MDERNNDFDFDFMPIGQAIKKAREARGMTREQLSGIIGYPNKKVKKSSVRRRIDAQLDNLDDKELSVIEATVNGLCKAKEPEE